ncbi:MAG: hypothetical protein L6R28_15585 [Planctomycetes bacterium]|nr:hypothetical protein [Planctomycetota bacterium]
MNPTVLCSLCGHAVPCPDLTKNDPIPCPVCGETCSPPREVSLQGLDNLQLEVEAEAITRSLWKDDRAILNDVEHEDETNETPVAAAPAQPAAAADGEVDLAAGAGLDLHAECEALCDYAMALFQDLGWACERWDDFHAFSMRAQVANPATDKADSVNVTVSSMGGILSFETVAMALPEPPWHRLREAMNHLNFCSNSSVFLLRECGVVVRHCVVPRKGEEWFTSAELMLAVRRLNYDRAVAVSLLEPVARTGLIDYPAIRRSLQKPLTLHHTRPVSHAQLEALSKFVGYRAAWDETTMHLSKDRRPPERCPVHLQIAEGALRVWAVPGSSGSSAWPGLKWGIVRQVMRNFGKDGEPLSRSQAGRLLERLNALNETASVLRFVWNQGQILALATYPPTERDLPVERYHLIVEAMMRCAQEQGNEIRITKLAM